MEQIKYPKPVDLSQFERGNGQHQALYGLPARVFSNTELLKQLQTSDFSIAEVPLYTAASNKKNLGACVMMKSQWVLNGAHPGSITYPNGNDHKTIYQQEAALTFGGGFSFGSINTTVAVPLPSTITPQVIIEFKPEDVRTNGLTYGLLGFRSTNYT